MHLRPRGNGGHIFQSLDIILMNNELRSMMSIVISNFHEAFGAPVSILNHDGIFETDVPLESPTNVFGALVCSELMA